ncbi:MAG: NADH-ubiquinone oxidoreductase subunit 4L [Candidatus Adiutrix intracellularis]|nr:MAG: NADH-ubiquinone oxidoreductase subunit 4L [Candidatus Adiutrix intracellularis]MDR2826796.1 NADH-quinone oxidoreductase subunit NuoK [Candidatus Adiutrix intracellularis]
MSPLILFMLSALLLLALGLLGLISRRTLVGMLISVELLLNGAGLSVVAAAQLTPASNAAGQLATIFIMGLAAAEATLVLAMIIVIHRRFETVETKALATLKDSPL